MTQNLNDYRAQMQGVLNQNFTQHLISYMCFGMWLSLCDSDAFEPRFSYYHCVEIFKQF